MINTALGAAHMVATNYLAIRRIYDQNPCSGNKGRY